VDDAIRKYHLHGIGEATLFEFYPIPPHEIHRSPEFRKIMDKVSDLGVPIIFDSGWSPVPWPLAYFDPFLIDAIANDYPGVTIIIGHSGKTDLCFFEHALMTARKHAHVYLELSYQTKASIEKAVRDVGAERCIFGTDWARRTPRYHTQLKAVAEAEISAEARRQILGENLARILLKKAQ
jgi:predicted TIM-barrel fold metal-dependent hydrolase